MSNFKNLSKIELMKRIDRNRVLDTSCKNVLLAHIQSMHEYCRGLDILRYMTSIDYACCVYAYNHYMYERDGFGRWLEEAIFGKPQWDKWNWGLNSWRISKKCDRLSAANLSLIYEMIRLMNLDLTFDFACLHDGNVIQLNQRSINKYGYIPIIGIRESTDAKFVYIVLDSNRSPKSI